MRNMKSRHIFQIIVIKREDKFKESLWEDERSKATLEYEKPRVNVTQRSSWTSIYVTFSFERGVGTFLLILVVAQLMRADYSPQFLESIEL